MWSKNIKMIFYDANICQNNLACNVFGEKILENIFLFKSDSLFITYYLCKCLYNNVLFIVISRGIKKGMPYLYWHTLLAIYKLYYKLLNASISKARDRRSV